MHQREHRQARQKDGWCHDRNRRAHPEHVAEQIEFGAPAACYGDDRAKNRQTALEESLPLVDGHDFEDNRRHDPKSEE
jgi:hypothetical protein